MKPWPLQTAPALVCLSGVVQSSRLKPLALEAFVWPAQSSRSQLARLWETHCLQVSRPPPPRKCPPGIDHRAQGHGKLKPSVFHTLLRALSARRLLRCPQPSMLTPPVSVSSKTCTNKYSANVRLGCSSFSSESSTTPSEWRTSFVREEVSRRLVGVPLSLGKTEWLLWPNAHKPARLRHVPGFTRACPSRHA